MPPTMPMSERVLETGHGLIITFPIQEVAPVRLEGVASPSVLAFFFKVLKWQNHFREYRQLPAITAGPANALDYGFLGANGHSEDPAVPDPGADVLRIENDDLKVYHLGFAPRDPNLRVYEKISASAPNRAVDHGTRNEPTPTAGDDHGFYTSRQIPDVFDPPALTERISIRNDETGRLLQFGFLADGQDVPDGGSDLIITGRTYQLQPVTDPAEQAFLLNQSMRDREDQTLPTVSVQLGGLFAWEVGSVIPDDWDQVTGLSQPLVLEGLSPPGEQGVGGRPEMERLEELLTQTRPDPPASAGAGDRASQPRDLR